MDYGKEGAARRLRASGNTQQGAAILRPDDLAGSQIYLPGSNGTVATNEPERALVFAQLIEQFVNPPSLQPHPIPLDIMTGAAAMGIMLCRTK